MRTVSTSFHAARSTRRLLAALALAPLAPLACSANDGAAGDSTALAATGAAVPTEECQAAVNVTAEGIGPARIGAPAPALVELCGGRDTSFTLGEGITEQGYVLQVGGNPIVALTNGDTVRRLIVREPGLTTTGGLGVGSTVADIRRAYPSACALVGEGLVVVAADSLPGVSFATSADFSQFAAGGAPQIAALPDTARVATMWVHGVARPCSEVR